MALHYAYVDVDGQAVSVFGSNGSLVSTEVTGAYGVPLQGAPSDYSSSPEAWVVDGLHGQEEDRGNEVSHFGARHTLFRDGMWMQPEPLLGLGPIAMVGTPQGTSSTYAGGNPLAYLDVVGYFSTPTASVDGTIENLGPVLDEIEETTERFPDPNEENGHLWVHSEDGGEVEAGGRVRGVGATVEFSAETESEARTETGLEGQVTRHHMHPRGMSDLLSGADVSRMILDSSKDYSTLHTQSASGTGGTNVVLVAPASKSAWVRKFSDKVSRLGNVSNKKAQQILEIVAPGSTVLTFPRSSARSS